MFTKDISEIISGPYILDCAGFLLNYMILEGYFSMFVLTPQVDPCICLSLERPFFFLGKEKNL